MRLNHIDRPPLGDINATILALCAASADADEADADAIVRAEHPPRPPGHDRRRRERRGGRELTPAHLIPVRSHEALLGPTVGVRR